MAGCSGWQVVILTMSSPPPIANILLPFDVLGLIFYYYSGNETIRHPLETLLLVCRAWSGAALGHRTIWNDIKIYIGHIPSSSIWRTRLPLRLARAGPVVPLFISIFDVFDMKNEDNVTECVECDSLYHNGFCTDPSSASWAIHQDQCPCYTDGTEFTEFVLECLAGNNGELCARWKKFHVDLGYGPGHDVCRYLARALSYPTPSLMSLLVENHVLDLVGYKRLTPLIEPPRLQELGVKPPQVPNFQTLLEVELHGTEILNSSACSDLRSASRLQVLCLRHIRPEGVILPKHLPNLYSITIIGEEIPISVHCCKIPNLSTVSLEFTHHNPVVEIYMCPGIDLRNLQDLSLIWFALGPYSTRRTVKACEDMVGSVCGLFTRAPNLSHVTGNRHIVNLFLKILWDSWSEHGAEGILGSKQFSLHYIADDGYRHPNGGLKAIFTGNNRPATLVTLAEQWGLVSPDLPRYGFLSLFSVSQSFPECAISNPTF
jgi:hypothetical protein